MGGSLPAELTDVLDRAAAHPRGLAFLHLAPVESVAVTLGVDARAVDHARASLEDRARRGEVIEAYQRAVERQRRDPATRPAPPARQVQAPPVVDPADLARTAEKHPLGAEFFMGAPLETVAVIFAAHPFVVLKAREILAQRGVAPGAEEEE